MAVNQHYLVVDKQEYLGQQVLNTYVYEQISTSGLITDLGYGFENVLVAAIKDCQGANLTHTGYSITCFEDPDQFVDHDYAAPIAGASGGEALPSFMAWSFLYRRTTRAVRNGHKRIGGLTESQLDSGGVPTAATLVILQGVATEMEADIGGSLVGVFEPRIWRREKLDPITKAVIWPDAWFDVSQVSFQYVSTQNTRKIGRGA